MTTKTFVEQIDEQHRKADIADRLMRDCTNTIMDLMEFDRPLTSAELDYLVEVDGKKKARVKTFTSSCR